MCRADGPGMPLRPELALVHETLDLPGDEGLSLTVYSADPGTPTADALRLLASWAAPNHETEPAARADTEH
ncbi:hypothetical protein SUDANB51_04856 [Streptomyces sp. enrichment culture]